MVHTIQLFGILIVATVLILFGHSYINPDIVFTSMIAGLAGIVGSRIAANGYIPASTDTASTNNSKSVTVTNLPVKEQPNNAN